MDGPLPVREAAGQGSGSSLDPGEWTSLRALGHRMLDDLFDDLQSIAEGPVWRPMPDNVRAAWQAAAPRNGHGPGGRLRRVSGGSWRLTGLATGTPGSSGGCMAAAPRSACLPRCWPPA